MRQALSKPVRRALALALLFAALLLAFRTAVLPFMTAAKTLADQIQQTRDLVLRLAQASNAPEASAPDAVKLLAEAGKRSFVSGESQSIRMANVQSAVVQLLSADDVKPRSVLNLPPRIRAGMTLVGVQVQAGLSLAQLQSVLARIDGHQPRLLVEDLQITRTAQAMAPGEGTPQRLDTRLDVFGIEPPAQTTKGKP